MIVVTATFWTIEGNMKSTGEIKPGDVYSTSELEWAFAVKAVVELLKTAGGDPTKVFLPNVADIILNAIERDVQNHLVQAEMDGCEITEVEPDSYRINDKGNGRMQ